MAIGNIAAETPHRDLLLKNGALHPLIDAVNEALVSKNQELIQLGTWALSNFLKRLPLPLHGRVADAIPVLCRVVQEVTDFKVLKDAMGSIRELSNREETIARLLEADMVPTLMRYLEYNRLDV